MSYLIKEIVNILRAARESKGLSQRALSEKTGLPQSHISKIENGAVDLQLSNLIELSRALDMELMLVPRKLVPTVQSLERSEAPSPQVVQQTKRARNELDRIGKEAARIQQIYPKNDEIPRIRNALKDLQSMSKVGEELKRLHSVGDQLKQFRLTSEEMKGFRAARGELKKFNKSTDEILKFSETAKQIHKANNELQNIRNTLAHSAIRTLPDISKVIKPAYSLDEEDEDG